MGRRPRNVTMTSSAHKDRVTGVKKRRPPSHFFGSSMVSVYQWNKKKESTMAMGPPLLVDVPYTNLVGSNGLARVWEERLTEKKRPTDVLQRDCHRNENENNETDTLVGSNSSSNMSLIHQVPFIDTSQSTL